MLAAHQERIRELEGDGIHTKCLYALQSTCPSKGGCASLHIFSHLVVMVSAKALQQELDDVRSASMQQVSMHFSFPPPICRIRALILRRAWSHREIM